MADIYEYPPFKIPNLKYLDPTSVHDSVVKLSFVSDEGPAVGTGFFFHIPDSPCEVILTAGHNLYSPKTKTLMTDVKVLFPNPSSDKGYPMPIPPEHIKVSAEYLKDTNLKEADYGVILIPYTEKMPRRGLGFKITYAFTELQGEVKISSYRGKTTPGRPVISTGPVLVKESTENQLVYDAMTEQGNSGSPVWFAEGGSNPVIAVVAVHNNGSKDGSGSRGSRISPKLLRDVYTWANLDTAKKIRAQNRSTRQKVVMDLPPSGLFMIFGGKPFARLQRGSGTTFDVLLAQVKPGSTKQETEMGTSYALALGTKWVMFDTENQQAVLVDSPRDQSLFRIKKINEKVNPGVVTISFIDNSQLRMDGSKFKPFDLPDAQVAGLSMVTGKPPPFIQFTFESDPSMPYKPSTQLIATAVPDHPQDPMSMLCPECRIKVGAPGIKSP